MGNKTPDFMTALLNGVVASVAKAKKDVEQQANATIYAKEASHEDWMRVKNEIYQTARYGRYLSHIGECADKDLMAVLNRLFPETVETKKKK